MTTIISLNALGTEVVHYYGTTDGWFYRATCGDDDYTVDTVNAHGAYTGTLGTTPTLAAAVQTMVAHQATGPGQAPQYPTYRTHTDGRRP